MLTIPKQKASTIGVRWCEVANMLLFCLGYKNDACVAEWGFCMKFQAAISSELTINLVVDKN